MLRNFVKVQANGSASSHRQNQEVVFLLLYFFVTTPSNSRATNCKPLSHMSATLNTTCMLIQSVTNIPASKYAYTECCKPTAHLLYQLLL